MKKTLSALVISLLAITSNIAHAEIIDFINKSTEQKVFLGSSNVERDLNEGKQQFAHTENCFENQSSASITGEIMGTLDSNTKSVYLVKTSSGLKTFEKDANYKIGDFVKNKVNTDSCQ